METSPFRHMESEEITKARIHAPFVIAPQSFLGAQEITAIAVAVYESESQQNEPPQGQGRWWLRHFLSEGR